MNPEQVVTNVLFAGVGGQGVLVASDILANTAVSANLDVKKSEVHGMAQRGGSVFSHVRFGPQIYSPLISQGEAHFIIAFEQLEALRYLEFLRPDGCLLINTQQIMPTTVFTSDAVYPQDIEGQLAELDLQYYLIDGVAMAEKLGDLRLLNVILLGALSTFLNFENEQWFEGIRERLADKYFTLNQKAFLQGQAMLRAKLETIGEDSK